MTEPVGTLLLLVHPAATRGRQATLARLRAALDVEGVDHEVGLLRRTGDVEAWVRQAGERGIRYLAVVGDDATVHDVVNALLPGRDAPEGEPPVLGLVPAGRGCDLARTFGLDRSPERAARHLVGDTVFPIDVGRVRLTGPDGAPRTRLFTNVAQVGYGGAVAERVEGLPRFLGRLRYLLAHLLTVRTFRAGEITVGVDRAEVTEPVSNVVVCNGQFYASGLKVAPRALPDDGVFNVQVWRAPPRTLFLMTPSMRVGEHLTRAEAREWQSATVRVEAAEPLPVEADGRMLGTTPATFDILPRALHIKI